MTGIGKAYKTGNTVASPGDVNGDGFADILIGSWKAIRYVGTKKRTKAGEVYVVYGGTGMAPTLDLATLDGTNGFRVLGAEKNHRLSLGIGGVGDINGGRPQRRKFRRSLYRVRKQQPIPTGFQPQRY